MKIVLYLVVVLFLVSCGSDSATQSTTNWYKPKSSTSWQWQLNGDLNTSYDVEVYDIDLFDSNTTLIQTLQDDGKRVICYFSAGSYEDWRDDKDDFPVEVLGNNLDGWPGERWLDISSDALLPIMKARLDLAKEKGCDGVEPDNVDGYNNNTGFSLSAQDQLTYNKFLAQEAHSRGLAIALKNDLSQVAELEPYFDLAVNEQCNAFSECDVLQLFIDADKPVFNAEYHNDYVENVNSARDLMCADSKDLQLQTLILPVNLDDSFRDSCQ